MEFAERIERPRRQGPAPSGPSRGFEKIGTTFKGHSQPRRRMDYREPIQGRVPLP
jgi:hypothetical protein